jgi:glycosyltransferase involved in cell wall biosynthesis
VPFVLSWSAVEAMGCGCAVIASDTAPVQELVQHGANGWLVPFFDPPAIAAQVAEVLANREDPAVRRVREAARQTVLGEWALTNCLPRQLALVQDAIDRR